ncbi:helix-turn-helix domain-containing protein [Methylobacterium sp. M6A4_1b]
MAGDPHSEPIVSLPRRHFTATITSPRQLQQFNDHGGIAVNFDTQRSTTPEIMITGFYGEPLSLWRTHSASGFVTKPKYNARLLSIRFVTTGHIVYRRRSGEIEGMPTHATLVNFDDLRETQASSAFSAVGGTFGVDVLAAAQAALTGGSEPDLAQLAPVVDVAAPGIRSLFLTLRQAQHRIEGADRHDDLIFPLIQEILSYQLLSAWPRRVASAPSSAKDISSRSLRAALDYIEANLSQALTLAEIAAAAEISVRSLQDKFRREIGCTPVQFIIERRLARAHADLVSSTGEPLSIADVARHWGFVHMGDFAQRYRRLYGRTPTETRRNNNRPA